MTASATLLLSQVTRPEDAQLSQDPWSWRGSQNIGLSVLKLIKFQANQAKLLTLILDLLSQFPHPLATNFYKLNLLNPYFDSIALS